MVKKHIKKGKSLTGKSGREAVKGASGIAASYITRSKALKKLQVNLKDFRRLCILKGIYPRDPKKKKEGKGKSYYHLKDIMYLQHEPLLQHFRDTQIFVRRFHRAKVMVDKFKMTKLQSDAPVLTLDHLIRERYPNFNLAINDLNEALNLLFLFNGLPQAVFKAFNEQHVQTVDQLLKEFLFYLAHTSSVTKMFISIKGIYVQAVINSITVTFIMPHKNPMFIPSDVDYRIMFTFLQFYEVLLKFTNFKLFHDASLAYPPVLDVSKNEKLAGFNSLIVSSLRSNEPVDMSTDEFAAAAAASSTDANDPAAEVDETQVDFDARRKVFKNCVFVLSREVNAELLALCLQSGGGEVHRHLEAADMSDEQRARVTHVIIDRPNTSSMAQFTNAHFVVPQWAVDSFNLRHRCPVAPYAPGQSPPPHLSPFIDDEKEGYVPKQREVLDAWKAGKTQEESEAEKANGEVKAEPEETEEARYARELEQERQGIPYSAAKAAEEEKANMDDSDDEEFDDDDSDDEDEDDAELEVESEDEVEPQKPAPKVMDEQDMPKIMMRNKDAKLYNAIQYGIKRKQKANDSLLTKRRQIEEAEAKSNKRAKKSVK